jgi:hypothetical protein
VAGLPEIPFVDIRGGTPVDLLARHPDAARALAKATTRTFGLASELGARAAFPAMDRVSRAWLERTGNPYREEIRAFEKMLGIRGVTTLNICFEWGCTSGAFRTKDGVVLRRVLDWKFPALGEHLVVAHQRGPAGDFYNVTWPGMSGIYHALAPGRFAAAINQAPMRRHGRGLALDWAKNRVDTRNGGGLPAAHLLRRVFETARGYTHAKRMLCDTPIAVPAIFILAGIEDGCVIERIEKDFAVREIEGDRACASNHFTSRLTATARGWLPRSHDSRERLACALALDRGEFEDGFAWFKAPIANPTSRVVVNASPAAGSLRTMGVYGAAPVTAPFALGL